jgi:hypothetical protein
LGLILLSLGLFVAGLPRLYGHLTALEGNFAGGIPLDAHEIRLGLAEFGISPGFYASTIIFVVVIFAGYCLGTAFLVVRRKKDDWLVLLLSLSYITYGTGYLYTISPSLYEIWTPPWDLIARFLYFFCGVVLYVVFFYLFPDGRFAPRWTRGFVLLILAWGIYITLYFEANPFLNSAAIPTAFGIVITAGVLLSVIVAQFYRYLYISDSGQKQQTKWVVFGFSIAILLTMAITLPITLQPSLDRSGPRLAIYVLAVVALGAIFGAVGLISLTIAILRFRLWDIDSLIRRTLLYGVLSSLLGIIYFGSVVLLQSVVQTITGRPADSSGIIVISTLAIAALFKPLRDRIQQVIDRRFFQQKYDAEKILEKFAIIARDEIDLKILTGSLVKTVEQTLHPEHVSLWLRE